MKDFLIYWQSMMIRSGNTSVLNINYCKFIQTMRPLNKVSTTVTYDKSYKLQNTRAEQCNELKRFSYTHLSYSYFRDSGQLQAISWITSRNTSFDMKYEPVVFGLMMKEWLKEFTGSSSVYVKLTLWKKKIKYTKEIFFIFFGFGGIFIIAQFSCYLKTTMWPLE